LKDGRNRVDADILQYFKQVGITDTGSSFSALGETVSVVEVFTLLFVVVAALAAAVWIVSAWRSLPALLRGRSAERRFLAQRAEILGATQEA